MPDQATILDGFSDLSGGMDSSRSPENISQVHCAFGVNVTMRDGMPKTRPPFRRVELVVPAALRTGYFQGSGDYYNPTTGARLLLAVVSGRIYSIDPRRATWTDLSAASGLLNDATAPHYFCQAESFGVISDGRDGTLIFDGRNLRRATPDEVPTCTIMTYGQGRLFAVSPDFRAFVAGDLVYGGSTTAKTILLSTPSGANQTKLTTTTPHGLTTGDAVTILYHYSTPSIIGTWRVSVVNGSVFTIPTGITSGAGGGQAFRANDGQETDVLRFTETRFLNEKGIFRLPAHFGKITAAMFFAFQDTGTGQGDLLVAGEHGACTFLVSQPRETWLNIPIQRQALTQIGFAGSRAHCQVNGDIFFNSPNGDLRSYRNARAEFGQYGNTPLSAEMQRVIQSGSPRASMALRDNRLLFTTDLKILASGDIATPPRYTFQSLTALDFQQSSRISKVGLAAYDGVWTGLNFQQLVPANFGNERRLYAWCWQNAAGTLVNELWEITDEDTGYDSLVTCADERLAQSISCSVELRAFDFNSWKMEKRLARLDVWLCDIRGTSISFDAFWRPDVHGGGWFFWGAAQVVPSSCAYLHDTDGCTDQPQVRPPFLVSPLRIGTPPLYDDLMTNRPADRGFTFQVRLDWTGRLQVKKLIAYAVVLPDPTQGDQTARRLTDQVTALPTNPKLMPYANSEWAYAIVSSAPCEYRPCVSFSGLATDGPEDFTILCSVDAGGPEEIQPAAGLHVAQRSGPIYYFADFDNGFIFGRVELTATIPADSDYAFNSFRVKITPDINDAFTSWTAIVAASACFNQPLGIVLNGSFTPS